MRRTVTPRSVAKRRRAGSDQPLKGSNLISEATVNVLEAGGRRDITRVEEERLHLCHEHAYQRRRGSRAPSLAPKR